MTKQLTPASNYMPEEIQQFSFFTSESVFKGPTVISAIIFKCRTSVLGQFGILVVSFSILIGSYLAPGETSVEYHAHENWLLFWPKLCKFNLINCFCKR